MVKMILHASSTGSMCLVRCLLFITFILSGCSRNDKLQEIDLSNTVPIVSPEVPRSLLSPLRVGGGHMITSKEGFAYYRQLLDYIGGKLRRPIEFVDRENYTEVNALLRADEVDMAFVCSRPYVEGNKEFGLELLAVPQMSGKTVYYAYIIVSKDSSSKTLADLKGKTFAFSDPMSHTGKLVPDYLLSKMGQSSESFFSKHMFTYAHDRTIKLVAKKVVDGGSVDSLVWHYWEKINPEYTAKTRIIETAGPFGIPPVVVRKGLDTSLKKELQNILLHAHEDQRCRNILSNMMIDRFVVVEDSAYDSIREMTRISTGSK